MIRPVCTRRTCLTLIGATGLLSLPSGTVAATDTTASSPPTSSSLAPSPLARPPLAPGLSPAPSQTVRGVRDDGTLALENGDTLALTGIRLPQASDLPIQARPPDDKARIAALRAHALHILRHLCKGQRVRPWVPALGRDRHGRMLAQVDVVTGEAPASNRRLWCQAILVAAGLARVETMAGAEAGATALLALETRARRARRGLWADPLYRVLTPADTWPWIGCFRIVRGVVVDAALVRSRLYLNFGPDWRRDFTVMVDRPRRTNLDTATVLDLKRQMIQVRGWLFPSNGPMIALDHAAALETRVWLE